VRVRGGLYPYLPGLDLVLRVCFTLSAIQLLLRQRQVYFILFAQLLVHLGRLAKLSVHLGLLVQLLVHLGLLGW